MDAKTYLKTRQVLWARRGGIDLIGSKTDRGEQAYTPTLAENLFRPLSDRARVCYEQGDGNELGTGEHPGKLQAVHSSAAIATNVFDYWLDGASPDAKRLAPLLKALRLPARGVESMALEAKVPVGPGFGRPPNLDVLFRYGAGAAVKAVAIECKFTEPYPGGRHGGLKPAYLADDTLWGGLPNLRRFAEGLSPNDQDFLHLHPAQLVKHVLGLTANFGRKYRLVYLHWDAPFEDGGRHRDELARFVEVAAADAIPLVATTWQAVIVALSQRLRDQPEHRAYVDYLTDRYL